MSDEPADDVRFAFGENWNDFLESLDASRIEAATRSLEDLLADEPLAERSFLDIGSGSGLSSLAAHRAGALVTSFDYDTASVRCIEQLMQRFGSAEPAWTVLQGSILDVPLVRSLGTFDVVYAWGVLHHTGSMWRAIELASNCVAEGGRFALAIDHDQGSASGRWAWIKRTYHR